MTVLHPFDDMVVGAAKPLLKGAGRRF